MLHSIKIINFTIIQSIIPFKTIKQFTNRPRKGNIQGRTLTEWQEHNPSIIKMTFEDNPVLVDANDSHEVSVFKIANLTA